MTLNTIFSVDETQNLPRGHFLLSDTKSMITIYFKLIYNRFQENMCMLCD